MSGVVEIADASIRALNSEMSDLRRKLVQAKRVRTSLRQRAAAAEAAAAECNSSRRQLQAVRGAWSAAHEGSARNAFNELGGSVQAAAAVQQRFQRLRSELQPGDGSRGHQHVHIDGRGEIRPGDTPAPPRL